jgi:hypothetical protein
MATKGKSKVSKSATTQKRGPQLDLPTGESQNIRPSLLLFDSGNLRLLERGRKLLNTPAVDIGQPATQKKIETALRETKSFDVPGLATSIANNGFLRHERLIVVNYDGQRYLTLEGNRRLLAVRYILEKLGQKQLAPSVFESLKTLPCFLLAGLPIVDMSLKGKASEEAIKRLKEYRKAAAVYVGLRHLMGSKTWEPASRYEFQANLILEDGWTLQQVASRFGRSVPVVRRDLQAQVLYRDFLKWETEVGRQHRVTYNAFSEATRAKSIKEWLGWSEVENRITNYDHEKIFFQYLSTRFPPTTSDDESELETPDMPSVEAALRQLRAMLDLGDPDINEALEAGEFEQAEVLFDSRKEGKFSKRVKGYVRGLRNATAAELQDGAEENKERLNELISVSKSVVRQIDGYLNRSGDGR